MSNVTVLQDLKIVEAKVAFAAYVKANDKARAAEAVWEKADAKARAAWGKAKSAVDARYLSEQEIKQ